MLRTCAIARRRNLAMCRRESRMLANARDGGLLARRKGITEKKMSAALPLCYSGSRRRVRVSSIATSSRTKRYAAGPAKFLTSSRSYRARRRPAHDQQRRRNTVRSHKNRHTRHRLLPAGGRRNLFAQVSRGSGDMNERKKGGAPGGWKSSLPLFIPATFRRFRKWRLLLSIHA